MTRFYNSLGTSLVLLLLTGSTLRADPREVRTLEEAAATVRAFADLPLRHIPHSLMRDAHGVAIIPGVVKAGFLLDGRFGHGVVLVRRPDGAWSNPAFVTLTGGGVGLQAGVESTDVVLIFRTPGSLDRILKGKGKLTLGGDVSVAAGPLGREAEAATDARLKAEILSYSRSRGLFAGASLEGAALLADHRANEGFYGVRGCRPMDVVGFNHKIAVVETLKGQLQRLEPPPVVVFPGATLPLHLVPLPPAPPPPGFRSP
jgi:lipid-binding SYLF domain-containing protein